MFLGSNIVFQVLHVQGFEDDATPTRIGIGVKKAHSIQTYSTEGFHKGKYDHKGLPYEQNGEVEWNGNARFTRRSYFPQLTFGHLTQVRSARKVEKVGDCQVGC